MCSRRELPGGSWKGAPQGRLSANGEACLVGHLACAAADGRLRAMGLVLCHLSVLIGRLLPFFVSHMSLGAWLTSWPVFCKKTLGGMHMCCLPVFKCQTPAAAACPYLQMHITCLKNKCHWQPPARLLYISLLCTACIRSIEQTTHLLPVPALLVLLHECAPHPKLSPLTPGPQTPGSGAATCTSPQTPLPSPISPSPRTPRPELAFC